MTIKAQPGTVIHGTLRTEDLVKSFSKKLHELLQLQEEKGDGYRDNHGGLVAEAVRMTDFTTQEASEMVSELQDALQYYAPDGHYFGTLEGDGSDFGFWPSDEEE